VCYLFRFWELVMADKKIDTTNTIEYSRTEKIKQRIDIFCGILIGMLCIAGSYDVLCISFGFSEPKIGLWRVGAIIILLSALPAMLGMFWIVGRCVERPDFNSLPSSKFTWGIPAVTMVIMVITTYIAQQHMLGR